MPHILDTDEISEEAAARGAVLLRLVPLFRPHRKTLGLATTLLAATTAAQLTGPLLIRHAIDVDIRGRSLTGLLLTVGAYVIVQAAFLVLNFVQKVRLETMGQDIILHLRRTLFARLLGQPVSFYDRNSVGRLISRVHGDTDALRQMFASTVVTLAETVVLFAGMLIVMILVSPLLTLIVAGMIPPLVLGAWVIGSGGARRFRAVRRKAAEISGYVAERVGGISAIQAFDREEASMAELEALNRSKFRTALGAEFFEMSLFHGVFYLETIGLVLVLWIGGRWAIAGSLSVGTLFMFIEYLRRLFDPVMRLSEQLDVMQRAVAAAGRVQALLDLQPELCDPSAPVRWDRFERAIEFRDVWFSYGGDEEYALRGVSFRIPRGETWAIVGATGGGKTSILNLLLRFYDPQRGAVLLDGHDARTLSQRDIRRRMALVLQDVYLFPGDVLSNISPQASGEDGADGAGEREAGTEGHAQARAREAARIVGADRFIERLPLGYRSALAERGANLSAGERQLLSFARALAADPEILLLDEATAAIDPETEGRIQEALAKLLAGRTAIIIAHRLSTVRDADCIIVVKDGSIVERGRHRELLAQGGVYSALYALQFQTTNGKLGAGGTREAEVVEGGGAGGGGE